MTALWRGDRAALSQGKLRAQTAVRRLLTVRSLPWIHGLGHTAVIHAPVTSRNQWPVTKYC